MPKKPFNINQRTVLISIIIVALIGFIITIFLLIQKLQTIEVAKKQAEDTLSLIENVQGENDINTNDLSDNNLLIAPDQSSQTNTNQTPDQLSDEVISDIDKNIQSINTALDFVDSELDITNLSK
jgi:uncharacterized membrane protein YcjF (UPF0283 family)